MLNLLKQSTKKSKLEEYNSALIELHSLLYRKLFLDNIKSANTKEQLKFYIKPKDKYQALHDNFIWFGSNKATSFIIIDIDYINTPIKQYKEEVINKLGIEPNWITRTNKGYHIGFILNSTIWLDNSTMKEKLIETKKNLTYLLDGDLAGSLKTNGFWRNPLTHKSIINTKNTYSLEEIHKISTQKIKNSITLFDTNEEINTKTNSTTETTSKINIDKIEKKGFTQGNRNNFLFTKTISMLYNNQITNNQVPSTLLALNNGELPIEEINKIAKSVMRYNIKPNSNNNKEYQAGEYYQALWDNKIHNYKINNKIKFSRQKFGQSSSVAKKIKNTTIKLVQAYTEIYQRNLNFTNKNISLLSKVSTRTVQIYRNKRKLEEKIKSVAFMEFIKSIGKGIEGIDSREGVKAKFTPLNKELINLINLAISEVEFIYSKTNEVYKFLYENDSMIFYRENEEMVA